jgi:hypothetical protein
MEYASMNNMVTAVTPTTCANRYLQQLAKHWAHKLEVEFHPLSAIIHSSNGAVATLEAGKEAPRSTIEAPDVETLVRMKMVLAEHLNRFAFREAPLLFDWK